MCLQIQKSFRTKKEAKEFMLKPLIAKKDIEVFKVLNKDNTSIYKDFQYTKGFEYTNDKFTIDYIRFLDRLNIHSGIHSCKTKSATQIHKQDHHKVVKMIVPKGAEYFENDDEIVSNRLIWY